MIRRVIDQQQVAIHYQPLVDLKTQKIFAYEALARPNKADFEGGPLQMFAAAVAENVTGELGRLLRHISVEGCQTHPLFINIHPAELNERYVVQPDYPVFKHVEDVYLEIT